MALTFRGGIHVNEHKDTKNCATEKMTPPAVVSIPMSQHIGAHATPCVAVGDTVTRGQVIGIIGAGLGCPVHSSVSGKVIRIDETNTAAGAPLRRVVIENDGLDTLCPDIKPWDTALEYTETDDIIDIVKNAGISGMGGATFPTYAKIKSAVGKTEHVIVNCAECEPYITANDRLLQENPDSVISGLKILMKALGVKKGIIAIEDNKPDAINIIRGRIEGDDTVTVEVLKTKYPQGDERQIIYALFKKELPMGKLPADVGCCIFNAETCSAVFHAFSEGMPLIERIVTVSGDCIKTPKNVLVPLGTSYRDLIDFCGGFIREPRKLINGGPMMGAAQWDIDGSVTKGTSALLALSEDAEHHYEQPVACIRCGRCVRGCPMHLLPSYLAMFSMQRKLDFAEQFDIMSCVECGSCSYNCPGHVPIVQYIRATKAKITDIKRAQQVALEQSKK